MRELFALSVPTVASSFLPTITRMLLFPQARIRFVFTKLNFNPRHLHRQISFGGWNYKVLPWTGMGQRKMISFQIMFYLHRLLGGKLFASAIVSLIYFSRIYIHLAKYILPNKKTKTKKKAYLLLIFSHNGILVFYVSNLKTISTYLTAYS